jgi:hypothetical protein
VHKDALPRYGREYRNAVRELRKKGGNAEGMLEQAQLLVDRTEDLLAAHNQLAEDCSTPGETLLVRFDIPSFKRAVGSGPLRSLRPAQAKGLEPLGEWPRDSSPLQECAQRDLNPQPLASKANALSS